MPKVTLDIKPEVASRIKRLARNRGVSVSQVVNDHFQKPSRPARPDSIPPSVREAIGMFTLPKGKSLEEFIEEAKAERAERHLR